MTDQDYSLLALALSILPLAYCHWRVYQLRKELQELRAGIQYGIQLSQEQPVYREIRNTLAAEEAKRSCSFMEGATSVAYGVGVHLITVHERANASRETASGHTTLSMDDLKSFSNR